MTLSNVSIPTTFTTGGAEAVVYPTANLPDEDDEEGQPAYIEAPRRQETDPQTVLAAGLPPQAPPPPRTRTRPRAVQDPGGVDQLG